MRIAFTYPEAIDLVKSFVGVSLIFWWVTTQTPTFEALLIISLFVGIAFILHELAHKAMASYYGYFAEYRSNDLLMLGSMFFAFFGLVFIAPGAVMVEGVRKLKHLGIISIVGPMTNILLALICLAFTPWFAVAWFGFGINAWLALFNMLPFLGLDGEKVLAWNKIAFLITIVVAGALYLTTYLRN